MNRFPPILRDRLEKLDRDQQWRSLRPNLGVDFSSNDYLGLSQDSILKKRVEEAFRRVPLGSSASRLLRGQMDVFEETEKFLAEFCGREMALLYPSGYQANVGVLTALLTPADVVFSDQFNHASIIDGIKLSGAKKEVFPHSHLQELEFRLQAYAKHSGLRVIVVESIFGMDGDFAPLADLARLANQYSALLIVDEAHATGLWGDFGQRRGGGLVQAMGLSDQVFATLHPAGKALGMAGAWVSGDQELKNYLVNFSRSFIFSTAPLPVLAVGLQTVLRYWAEVGVERANSVHRRSAHLRRILSRFGPSALEVLPGDGPIIPIVLGANSRALNMATRLQELGFDIRAIRPPTVPVGRARLRLTANLNHSIADIDRLDRAFRDCLSVS